MRKNKTNKSVQSHQAIVSPLTIFVICSLTLLTILPSNLWAQADVTIAADANGDTIFNGTSQVLRITITTNAEASGPYKIIVEPATQIFSGTIAENRIKTHTWNGEVGDVSLPEGTYTLRIEVGERDANGALPDTGDEATIQVTIDRTPPEISITTEERVFSPNRDGVLDRLDVFYSLSETVETSRVEFLTASGTEYGQADQLREGQGGHTYRWDGGDGSRSFRGLPDGIYTLRLRITDKAGNEKTAQTDQITIDTVPPRIPSGGIKAITNAGEIELINGRFVNQAIRAIKITPDKGESIGSAIDFTSVNTEVRLRQQRKAQASGTFGDNGTDLTFTLSNPLDSASENGTYTLNSTVADKAGNTVTQTLSFVFDNIAPTLTGVATSNGALRAGDGVSKSMNFVEATIKDNLPNGLNLSDSTIRLKGPDDAAILGRQTQPKPNTLRWNFLNPLLAKDGIYDGEYTIEILGTDNAGNSTEVLQIPFVYDNKAPEITSLALNEGAAAFTPLQDTVYYSQPINQIIATFEESGIGIQLEAPTNIRFGTTDADGRINVLPGRTLRDKNNNRIAYILTEPLTLRDGSQDGNYTLNVRVADTIGNSETHQFQLIYDTQLPTLVSTVPASNQNVSSLAEVQINLNEITSGIDFIQSTFRLKHNDEEVPVNITSNGTGSITLTVLAPFAVDGSDDGTYVIEVTPIDRAGNQGATARRAFFLVSQTRTKISLIHPETTIVNSFTADATGFAAVELVDYIGVGIDFEKSTLVVKGPNGVAVPRNVATAPADEANHRLTWNTETLLPDDGSADGEYTITATFVDFNGQQWTENFTFNVDTQSPPITNVEALTTTPTLLEVENVPVIEETFSRITVNFQAEDIDISNTAISLSGPDGADSGPDGADIAINVTQDNKTSLTLTFLSLMTSGDYRLSIHPQDYLGNASPQPFVYSFRLRLNFGVPKVSRVTALTTTPTLLETERLPVIEETFSRITVNLELEAEDIDISNTAISLSGPDGADIAINVTQDNKTSLTLTFLSLMTSGDYRLSIHPQDYLGNASPQPFVYSFRLRLNFGVPKVSSVEIGGEIGALVYVNGGATSIVATFIDVTETGLSFENDGSRINVTNADGIPIPGITVVRGTDQLVWQPLSQPTDGTADGTYTVAVTPVDKEGRQGEVALRQFVYDTQPPRITAASPIALRQPLSYLNTAFSQNGAEFSFTVEDVGPAQLTLNQQHVKFLDADGNPLEAVLTNDGTSQFFLTLSEPLGTDGSTDGNYSLTVALIDKAGNSHNATYPLVYDTQPPQLDTVTLWRSTAPNDTIQLMPTETEIITDFGEEAQPDKFSVVVKFTEAIQMDFANTTIQLTGPDDASLPLNLSDDGEAQLTAQFFTPQVIGDYTLSITPQDRAGNRAQGAVNYRFRLDLALPSVTNVLIDGKVGGIVYVNGGASGVIATLEDPSGTGLAFGNSGSTITVTNASGLPVPGTTTNDGENQLMWQPLSQPTDGTADGTYTVAVTPVDKEGRQGEVALRQFVYDTQPPRITAASPIALRQPLSYLNTAFSQNGAEFSFTVEDVGPAQLTLNQQHVKFLDADGNPLEAVLTNDGTSQFFLTLSEPLGTDGSTDGNYSLTVALIDKAGNSHNATYPLVYDTQPPQLVSTIPADGDILTDDITQVHADLNDAGGSQIDFALTTLTVVAPDGEEITGELSNDNDGQLTLTLNPLVADGRYRIHVSAMDRAGNGGDLMFERSFILSRTLPTVISTEPVTAPDEDAFTNQQIEQIELQLETDDERHLSTVRLLAPGAKVIAGQQQREPSRLTYKLARPLAQDGSEDGIYTIEFTPVSASGRAGEAQHLTFTYDTQAPELEIEDIRLVVAQPGVNNSLTEIRVQLTDNPSGIDWDNLNEEWLTLERITPIPTKIAGKISDVLPDTLRFQLTVPLADDGSNDGEYRITVSPKDRAGNTDEPYQKQFTYDLSPPRIDESTLLLNGKPLLVDLEAIDYPTATSATGGVVIQAKISDTGLGVNLAQSEITVRRPDGAELPGIIQQNGVDTLVFKSEGLSIRGPYKVTVTGKGNDPEFLGFAPTDSITTEFLYETTVPTATVTSDGGEMELTDEPFLLEGTATDPNGTQAIGEREQQVPASGVWLVEIIGTGPDNQPIEPVLATDDSNAEEELWSRWSLDFLPARSGEYDLDVRVTDNAGNYAIYDIGKVTMSVSLTFREPTFGWPNPLRISKGDVAFFSFDVNVPRGETVEITLNLYDWSGNMVLSQTYPDVVSGQRNDQLIKWNLENQAGNPVARGIYVFRLEAVNATGNRANTVGKLLVVD